MSVKQIKRETKDFGIELGYEVNHYSRSSSDFDFGSLLSYNPYSQWKDIEEFHDYLVKNNHENEPHYGIFDKNASIINFYADKNGESILADIMAKNEENNMGNVNIPGTDVKLVNYSYCPKCNKIYSQQDLIDYYNKPVIRPGNNLRYTLRKETRVICNECNTVFYPTLIIVDGSPKNYFHYLCRMQTVNAIEDYMKKRFNGIYLTKNKENIIYSEDKKYIACKNDLKIIKLIKRPTYITNFIQYSNPSQILNFIDGTNIEKEDIVFNMWQKRPTRDSELALTRIWR